MNKIDLKNKQNHVRLLLLASLVILSQCKNSDPILEPPQTIHLVETYNLELGEGLDFITNFQFAKDETIWIGTFSSGIYHISGNTTVNFNTSNSPLPNNKVNDVFIDHIDRVWIATDNGFAMYEDYTWEVYTIENTPLTLPNVSQIVVNNLNEILIGNGDAVEGGLLFRTHDGRWKSFTTENSLLPCSYILDIDLTKDGNFWVSTGQLLGKGGVVKFENEKVTIVLNIENSGLLYNWIDNIEISEEYLWTGFEVPIFNKGGFPDGGIQRTDLQSNKTISYFPHSTGLISNRIIDMKLHSDNSLWFTTGVDDPFCENCFGGIGVLFENEEFLVASVLNSDIPSNVFFPKLNEDNNGNMYVASELSLYKVELRE